jgi:hypothetical protein
MCRKLDTLRRGAPLVAILMVSGSDMRLCRESACSERDRHSGHVQWCLPIMHLCKRSVPSEWESPLWARLLESGLVIVLLDKVSTLGKTQGPMGCQSTPRSLEVSRSVSHD